MPKQDLIEEFTKLLIKQDLEDKATGKVKYVKKVRVYKDVIKLLKHISL